jgi:two-component system, OmpR family, sensor histidine kinase QseC
VNISIRKFLLINLLLALTITTTLTVVGNYFLDKQDIERHLDTIMAKTCLSYQALIGDNTTQLDFTVLQKAVDNVHFRMGKLLKRNIITDQQQQVAEDFNFQVWDENWLPLIRSPNAPTLPLSSGEEGFSNQRDNKGHEWRVFTSYSPRAGTMVMVGERRDTRDSFGRTIALDDIYIMLFTFPLSGILIWVVIGRGLSSLNRIAEAVSSRDPIFLKAVDVEDVPLEIKPLIEALNQLFFRLQQAFDREKRFAADAAHELRTPLAALKIQAQVARGTQDNQERQTALQNLIIGVDRSSHIVQQLLTLSRLLPETTYIDESMKVDLEKIATDAIAQLVPAALAKNIEIELRKHDRNSTVYGNATAISILCRNLIDNAIRYSASDGHVLVTISNDAEACVVLSVADNGPGIPAELQDRVFERFYRVIGTKPTGSGLGLAIVSQIANLHQAEVKLSSPEHGSGLQVSIHFPPKISVESR